MFRDNDIAVLKEDSRRVKYVNKRVGNYVKYKDAEAVFEEGSEGKEVYFILSGRAEVSQHISGKKEITAILQEGDFFGEMAALNDDIRSMTVTAIGELDLRELSLDEMFDHMEMCPEILRDMFGSLTRRLRDTNFRVRELTSRIINSSGNREDQLRNISHLDRLNILVIDDHPNNVEALRRILCDEYNVFTALEGSSALQIMRLHDIALVLADYRMPGMSGIELLASIKLMYPNVIRIILGGYFDQDILMKAIKKINVHDLISKPWRSGEVTFTVARWIEQYRKTKRLERKASQCSTLQERLEEANDLIQQLMQELKEANPPEYKQASFWPRWKQKRE